MGMRRVWGFKTLSEGWVMDDSDSLDRGCEAFEGGGQGAGVLLSLRSDSIACGLDETIENN